MIAAVVPTESRAQRARKPRIASSFVLRITAPAEAGAVMLCSAIANAFLLLRPLRALPIYRSSHLASLVGAHGLVGLLGQWDVANLFGQAGSVLQVKLDERVHFRPALRLGADIDEQR